MGSTPRQMVICTIFYLYIVEVESVDKLGGGTENKAGLKRALLPCIDSSLLFWRNRFITASSTR